MRDFKVIDKIIQPPLKQLCSVVIMYLFDFKHCQQQCFHKVSFPQKITFITYIESIELSLEMALSYQIITDSPSLLTAVTVTIVFINSLCAVVFMHLLNFRSSVSTKTLIFQAMIYSAFGLTTCTIIFSATAAPDWFATHVFCFCHVIITNILIDLTLVRIYKKKFDTRKCSEVWKILSVLKKVRIVLFGAWLMTSIYCCTVPPERAGESFVFEGKRTLTTLLVLIIVIIPAFVLAILLILLREVTSKPTPELLEELNGEKVAVSLSV